ncbi:MAG: TlpA disulfide reductase family protein, partial [Pirellula sp.]
LEHFSTLANLESLDIQANDLGGITDKGVRSLAQASQLKSLSIDGALITDDGLTRLRSLEHLENLELECMATPVGLEGLGSLKRLNFLTISSPNLCERDVEDFRTRYPHRSQIQFRESSFSLAKSKDKRDPILRRGSNIARTELNALEGNVAPALVATSWTSSDGEVKLADFKGKIVLIDFWGTWCGAYLQKLPQIRELHGKFHDKGLVVIGIHSTADSENVDSFLKRNPLPWVNGIDTKNQTAKAYSVGSWPSIYLVDRHGKLRIANPIFDQLEQAIQSLLDE